MNRNCSPITDCRLNDQALHARSLIKGIGWKKAYAKYRTTEHWAELKRRMGQERPEQCEICQTTENVDLHHLQYKNWALVRLADLVWLCREHHEAAHLGQEEEEIPEEGESTFLLRDTLHALFSFEQDKILKQLNEGKADKEELVEELYKTGHIIAELKHLLDSKSNLEGELRSAKINEDNLEIDNKKLSDSLTHYMHMGKELQVKIQDKQSNIEKLSGLINDYEGNKKLLAERLKESQSEINEYEEAIVNLQNIVAEKDQSLNQISVSAEQQQVKLGELSIAINDATARNDSLATQLSKRISKWMGGFLLVAGLSGGFFLGRIVKEVPVPFLNDSLENQPLDGQP